MFSYQKSRYFVRNNGITMRTGTKLLISFLSMLLSCTLVSAQEKASVLGRIIDAVTGETLIGATVSISGTSLGTVADMDGHYRIGEINPGTYDILFSYMGYEPLTIHQVVLIPGAALELSARMNSNIRQLQVAEVVSTRITNSENAVLAEMRKSEQLIVGVSSQQIARTQDRTASEVIRRLPGVTLMEERFIVLRGLSERYNSVMLNGAGAPSAEPDKRAFSFDMIPSSMLDRILIYKTGAPELPGDFAGGVVKVFTKNHTDEDFVSAGTSLGIRTGTTFTPFNRAPASSTDWIGTGNGTRDLPVAFPDNISGMTASEQAELARLLPNTWIVEEQSAPIDQRYNAGFGKEFRMGKVKCSNVSGFTYGNSYENRQSDNLNYNQYDIKKQLSDTIYNYTDRISINRVNLGLLSNFSLLFNTRHKIEFKNLYNQSGSNTAIIRTGYNLEEGNDVRNYAMRYFERQIYSGQLSGGHSFNQERTQVSWTAGYSTTLSKEPDYRRIRTFRSLVDNIPDYYVQVNTTASQADAGRFYSNLNETNTMLNGMIEQELSKLDELRRIKIKTGFYLEEKDRIFSARWLAYTKSRVDIFDNSLLTLPLGQIFQAGNFNDSTGFKIDEGTNGTDRYTAKNSNYAGFTCISWPFRPRWNVSAGLRIEYNRLLLQSKDNNGRPLSVDNPLVSALPSVNLSYTQGNKSIIRAAWYRTLNRPEFREIAPFSYYDFIFNNILFGNPKLTTPVINNYDLRWELYPAAGELISAGIFYKQFNNPIEQYFKPGAGSGGTRNFEFRNALSAISAGAEIEMRKSLSSIWSRGLLSRFAVSANAAFIHSRVNLGNEAVGQDQKRIMMGQSPFVINTGLFYQDPDKKLQWNLQYNIVGRRLFLAGTEGTPDVYELPRHVIDLSAIKGLGKHLEIKAGIQDLLNQPYVLRQDSNLDDRIQSNDELLMQYRRGTYFTLGITATY